MTAAAAERWFFVTIFVGGFDSPHESLAYVRARDATAARWRAMRESEGGQLYADGSAGDFRHPLTGISARRSPRLDDMPEAADITMLDCCDDFPPALRAKMVAAGMISGSRETEDLRFCA